MQLLTGLQHMDNKNSIAHRVKSTAYESKISLLYALRSMLFAICILFALGSVA